MVPGFLTKLLLLKAVKTRNTKIWCWNEDFTDVGHWSLCLFADSIVLGSDLPGSRKIIVDVCPDIRLELDLD